VRLLLPLPAGEGRGEGESFDWTNLFRVCQLRVFAISVFLVCAGIETYGAGESVSFKFFFGNSKPASGYVPIGPAHIYSPEVTCGFELGASITSAGNCCTSTNPFYFSVALPEGNYRVAATFGGSDSGSTNTVKSELRRLMLENVVTPTGKFVTRTFTVNVRTPKIAGDGEVRLKERERTIEMWNWDEKLTLEFNGTQPSLSTLEIERADDLPVVYLLGDSTVCDQPSEPWNSWGQMLPRFFKPEVVVANHAQSGESLKSSLSAKRLDKVLSAMKRGDYLFIQYGHNDMKDRSTNALATYTANLRFFVTNAKRKGGIPVLVTSMERKAGIETNTLGEYPATVREVAKEENITLIDLHAMSKVFYRALGSRIDAAFQDGTHHNNYGSYELAKCVVQGIKDSKLDLAKFIAGDFKDFDPAHPDPVDGFEMPASPTRSGTRPLGD